MYQPPYTFLQTALHLATRYGFPKCVQVLLDYGAQLDIKTSRKETAESLAANGKPMCKHIIEYAVAKYRIPKRSKDLMKTAEGKLCHTAT